MHVLILPVREANNINVRQRATTRSGFRITMDICTFWYGRRLRMIDRVCLASMVRCGMRVKLYSYDEVENLPSGVERREAHPFLSLDVFRRLHPRGIDGVAIQQFSDIFRIMLMKHGQGFWLDTDVLLLKPFDFAANEPYVARENRCRVGVSAMYFPRNHPVIGEFEAYLAGNEVLPSWLGLRRGVLRPALYRAMGRDVCPVSIGITVFGNDGISRLARKYGFFSRAAPQSHFYALVGEQTEQFYEPDFDFRSLFRDDVYGLHVHRKEASSAPPRPGSMFEWALNEAGLRWE